MPLERISANELSVDTEYVRTLRTLKVGEGVRASTKTEGAGKVTLKKRLQQAADVAGLNVKFHRTNADTVVLEVVGRNN